MNTLSDSTYLDRLTTFSREQAQAFERDVLRQVANLALLPPHVETNPLPAFGYDRLDYGMNLSLERSPGGRIFAAWVGGEDGPRAFMLLATSDDGGDSWSDPRLVIHGDSSALPCPRSVIVGTLWCDPLGRLWFFFDQTMHHFDGRGGLWATRCDQPDAEELVWTTPVRIWHGSVLNKPIALASGEWLLPAQLLQSNGYGPFRQPLFPELDPLRGVNLLVSTDHGATWHVRGRITVEHPTWHEPTLVERRDASLWMLVRTSVGVVETISRDCGRTWTVPQPHAVIRQTPSRCHLRRLASGRILLIKNGPEIDQALIPPHPDSRAQLSAWLSDDDGSTWQGGLILDDRPHLSYPDGFQASDGRIHVSYDCERKALGHIMLARFTEDDVLAKRVVRPGSELQRIIIRPLAARP